MILNKIFNCDCIEGMKKLADNSVDMILSDLPYNSTSAEFDKNVIDLEKFWTEARRILKPCCSAVMFASSKFSYKLQASNFENYRYKWIWVKNAPTFFVHAKNTVTQKRMKYFPQGLKNSGRFYKGNKAGKIYNNHNGSLTHTYQAEFSNYPKDVLYFDVPFNCHRLHPSQKPVGLLEFLIKTYTRQGETVLDACIGSGSTAVAAMNTNRNFIGFEIDEKYFAIAEKRIEIAFADKERRLLDFTEE